MSDNLVILNYEGPVKFDTTEKLLQQVKIDLASHDIKKILKKRIYTILVECIENMLRHHAEDKKNSVQPYIKLEKDTFEYRVTTRNLILNSDVAILKAKLDKIANSDMGQLHDMYEAQINQDADLTQNGAGLGLLTIALKSNNPLNYNVIPVNEQHSVFELQVIITIDNN